MLCALRLMIGYATSCPGPWNVASPPLFVLCTSAPSAFSLSASTSVKPESRKPENIE